MNRSRQIELMDSPAADPDVLREALGEIEYINRALGGYGPSLEALERFVQPAVSNHAGNYPGISILDVGCGNGDTLRRVVDWARQRGLAIRAVGIDLSEAGVSQARAASAAYPEITIERRDLFALNPARQRYDIIHAAMMLHHMPDDAEIRRALRAMAALARTGVIINDLHRHALARSGIATLTRLFSRNRFIRHDAPLSVARGFTRHELLAHARAAGLAHPHIFWRWAFRWVLMGRVTG